MTYSGSPPGIPVAAFAAVLLDPGQSLRGRGQKSGGAARSWVGGRRMRLQGACGLAGGCRGYGGDSFDRIWLQCRWRPMLLFDHILLEDDLPKACPFD